MSFFIINSKIWNLNSKYLFLSQILGKVTPLCLWNNATFQQKLPNIINRKVMSKVIFFILWIIGFYDSVLKCKPKFGVFALYNHSVYNITNIAYSYKNRYVLTQR